MPFQFHNATIAARSLTIGEDEDATALALLVRADVSAPLLIKHVRFAEFMYAAEITGEWPLPRVTKDSPSADILACYAAWRGLPRTFAVRWQQELDSAESLSKNGFGQTS